MLDAAKRPPNEWAFLFHSVLHMVQEMVVSRSLFHKRRDILVLAVHPETYRVIITNLVQYWTAISYHRCKLSWSMKYAMMIPSTPPLHHVTFTVIIGETALTTACRVNRWCSKLRGYF